MCIPSQYEPSNTQELRRNAVVFAIFQAVGWTKIFEHLNGFHHEAALQFALNLTETHLEVWGLRIEVSEAIMAKFIGIPQVGRAWFGCRVPTNAAVHDFLIEGE